MKRLVLVLTLLVGAPIAGCDGTSSADDAGASTPDAGGDTYDCDPKHVACEALPPECPPGFLPAVSGDCWDVCVEATACEPVSCGDSGPEPQCPGDWGCIDSECRAPR